ncbi:unnamed protein product, partial [Mesorhabditis belari]|uniref:Myosin heavy chain n=1 Tax=Mesorhabditis belari TaxID=2138241 RepID=A0AAF3FEU4_9BILA
MAFYDHEKDPGWQYLRRSREEMLKDQSIPYDSKKNVWVPDAEDGFVAAEINATKGDSVTVTTCKGNQQTFKKDALQEMNPPKFEKTEDMSNLSFLNDASVLHNLRARYASMLIYTYSGLFCVVINPYKRLPIYTESVANMYMGKRRNEMPPHLFAVSDEAYRNMLLDHANQSMLITGESGAGKTENTKKVIAYFAAVGQRQTEAEGVKVDAQKVTLEDQIVRTNPVLEAFGNAKTVRNNNSSRFGKFIRIHFSRSGRVASCDIEHYLLEKSRVIRQAPGERCYHIFYQIFSGYKPSLTKELLLDKPVSNYWFVAQAELTIDGVDDREEFQMTDESFDILNFSAAEKMNCFRIVSAMMHMGNMKFKQRPREEQAEPDATDEAEKVAKMFGVDMEQMLSALCKPRVKVGAEWVSKGQNVDQVNWAVGAMAKGLYNRLFTWIVQMCNKTLDQKGINRDYFIGVLDIAGFEIFDLNSFEQLWINFVNEKLQQFFNHHMFVLEQEEYQREGIAWTFIDFGLDLQACIELIEKPLGIISMLDEECIVPKATDMTLAQKLCDQHLGKHSNFEKPKPPKGKQAEAHFAMKHYAGTVRYNVTNWLEKNKDPLNDSFVSILKHSNGNELLQVLWEDYTTQEEAANAAKDGTGGKKKGKSGSFMTVSMLYRESLNNLMSMLNKTHPHFIRCIIPNEKKQSGLIDAALVLNQLTCNGVLEGIRICRKGYPNRCQHLDFRQRYAVLAAQEAKAHDEPKKCAEAMMSRMVEDRAVKEEEFKIGKTKVFFKAGVLAHLEDLRDEKLGIVLTNFQASIRWYLGLADRRRRMTQRAGLLVLQRNIRTWTVVRTWNWYLLFGKIRPMLKVGKEGEEVEKLNEKLKEMEEKVVVEEGNRKKKEVENAKLIEEKNQLFAELENIKGSANGVEERVAKLQALYHDAKKQLTELEDQLVDQEERNGDVQRARKKVENDLENLRRQIADIEGKLTAIEQEKSAKDQAVRSLQDEMGNQDECIARLNKEKKALEEANRKLIEDLQGEEDKNNMTTKSKGKLERALDDLEDALEREKRARSDIEKQKRKIEGELSVTMEKIEEVARLRADLETHLKRKEAEQQTVQSKFEEEQSIVAKLQRQIKDGLVKISELEDEVENERQSRARSERAKADLQRELDQVNDRIDEAGGATAAQIEINRKREAELAKLRHQLEELNQNHENQLAALRKKHTDSVSTLTEQLDENQKAKVKAERDRVSALHDVDTIQAEIDSETSARMHNEKLAKQLEIQVHEMQSKADEQMRQLAELQSVKSRLNAANGDLGKQIEDAESQLSQVTRSKAQLQGQLEEARRTADEEAREKQHYAAQARNHELEANQLREQIEEEAENKNELLRQLSKVNGEIQGWKSKLESEGLLKSDELEEVRRRQQQKINDLQGVYDQAMSKVTSLEKTKARLASDLEEAQSDVERANNYVGQLEKTQKGFDKQIDDWRRKSEELNGELEMAQRDARNAVTDLLKAKNGQDELQAAADELRRENGGLAVEVRDLQHQLADGGRSVQEMQRIMRTLELEKEELQHAVDEAEAALEAEESKVLRAQVEVSQIRAEIEKRLTEKDEEFENTRKNHQRAMESMQQSLENEQKAKTELGRLKKKLESDVTELELALDHANQANAEALRNLKKHQDQLIELQRQVEEEQRSRDELREQYFNVEKKVTLLQAEKEELTVAHDAAVRARRQAENEAHECRQQADEFSAQLNSLQNVKRKLEGEIQALHGDLDETLSEFKAADENANRAIADAQRLADQLRNESEHCGSLDRAKKSLEQQLRDLQTRLDEAEAAALKGGKKLIAQLEKRAHDLEQEMEGEQRRFQLATKELNKHDRKGKELQFQIDEDKKNFDRLNDLVEKLQNKTRQQKRNIEEAEEQANTSLSKYRQVQHQLEDAEERADSAENNLSKMRAKSRGGSTLQGSASVAVMRAPSRSKF